jgi:hypothetical protein
VAVALGADGGIRASTGSRRMKIVRCPLRLAVGLLAALQASAAGAGPADAELAAQERLRGELVRECADEPSRCFIAVGNDPKSAEAGQFFVRDSSGTFRNVHFNPGDPRTNDKLELVPMSEFKLFRGCWPARRIALLVDAREGESPYAYDFRFGPSGAGTSLQSPPFDHGSRQGDMNVDVFQWRDYFLVKYRRNEWITESVLVRISQNDGDGLDADFYGPVTDAFGSRAEIRVRRCPAMEKSDS